MIDLKAVIVNSDGEPMKQNFKTKEITENGKEKETSVFREITLKDIIKVSLLKNSQQDLDKGIKGDAIAKRYQLWKKMQGVEEIELDRKEKKLLKKLIYQHYEILVAGQALEIIN